MIQESTYLDLIKLLKSYEYLRSKAARQIIVDKNGDKLFIWRKHCIHWDINQCLDNAGKIFFVLTKSNKKLRHKLRQQASGSQNGKKIEQLEYFVSMIKLAIN